MGFEYHSGQAEDLINSDNDIRARNVGYFHDLWLDTIGGATEKASGR